MTNSVVGFRLGELETPIIKAYVVDAETGSIPLYMSNIIDEPTMMHHILIHLLISCPTQHVSQEVLKSQSYPIKRKLSSLAQILNRLKQALLSVSSSFFANCMPLDSCLDFSYGFLIQVQQTKKRKQTIYSRIFEISPSILVNFRESHQRATVYNSYLALSRISQYEISH
ncbi:hypothetical protein EDC96DRAFT_547069 [Choanephora cucurbitarum]|nr:hypothetical protein EDC96DRAFT_547069 [Choanephora cucurbitarum]